MGDDNTSILETSVEDEELRNALRKADLDIMHGRRTQKAILADAYRKSLKDKQIVSLDYLREICTMVEFDYSVEQIKEKSLLLGYEIKE